MNQQSENLIAIKTLFSTVTGIIDEERKMKHRKFADKVEEVINKPEKIDVKYTSESVDIAYPPVVQSGGVYDLKSVAHPSGQRMHTLLHTHPHPHTHIPAHTHMCVLPESCYSLCMSSRLCKNGFKVIMPYCLHTCSLK